MKIHILVFVFISITIVTDAQELENLIGSPIQSCLNCMCHARSGCWSRYNCARYSISKDYWEQAGSPLLSDGTSDEQAYRACMSDENCILNTLKSYTERYGEVDCNCDGFFDCKDRLAIHLLGEDCLNPQFGDVYASRFNDCAKQIGVTSMSAAEGSCVIPEVDPV